MSDEAQAPAPTAGVRPGAPVRMQGPPERAGTLAELSRPGRRAFSLPPLDVPEVEVPPDLARRERAGLPEVAERDLVSH
ncbi:MAG: hypothetical protein ACXWX2_06020, partial [Actinomycetota bacterium]